MAHTHDSNLSLVVLAGLDDDVVECVTSWTSRLLTADHVELYAAKIQDVVLTGVGDRRANDARNRSQVPG